VFKAYRRNNPMITKVTDQTACGRASLLVLDKLNAPSTELLETQAHEHAQTA